MYLTKKEVEEDIQNYKEDGLTIHSHSIGEQPCCSVDGCREPGIHPWLDHPDYPHLCHTHWRKLQHRIEHGWSDPYQGLGCIAPVRENDRLWIIHLFSALRGSPESKPIATMVIRSQSKNSASRRLNRIFPQLRGVMRSIRLWEPDGKSPFVHLWSKSGVIGQLDLYVMPDKIQYCSQHLRLNVTPDVDARTGKDTTGTE